ncbi:MAG: M23 family metallopeptidase [Candidatus Delongbacteria bacterium]|nr:M23 family metallopeptidase [Candidatus Delongbacteria bacterium]
MHPQPTSVSFYRRGTILVINWLLLWLAVPTTAVELLQPCSYRVITSGFGDSRQTHFHAGIDISTVGKEGIPVIAVASGHVSRLKVRHHGYGRALYYDTTTGVRAVYAHLSRFTRQIDSLVLAEQLVRGSYEVEFYPSADQLQFVAGDTLGWSGQSGAGHPHLHFELRTLDDIAINPQRLYPHNPTGEAPRAQALLAVPCDPGTRINGFPWPLQLQNGDQFNCNGPVRFYYTATQANLPQQSPLPVRRAELRLDDRLLFFHNDSLDFEQNGWWRVLPPLAGSDWRLLNQHNLMSDSTIDQECLEIPTGTHLQLIVEDDSGLQDTLTCDVSQLIGGTPPVSREEWRLFAGWLLVGADLLDQTQIPASFSVKLLASDCFQLVPTTPGLFQLCLDSLRTFLYLDNKMEDQISCGPWQLSLDQEPPEPLLLELVWDGERIRLSPADLVLPQPLRLSIALTGRLNWLYQKQGREWQPVTCSSNSAGDTLYHTLRYAGEYAILSDTLPPGIVFRHPSGANPLVGFDEQVQIQLTDALSGVYDFSCRVDRIVVYPEYDADRDRLLFHHDSRIAPGDHQLQVEVTDRVGNRRQRSLEYRLLPLEDSGK